MSTVNGLPAHILLVHVVVVLIPIAALLLVLAALWPAARRRIALPAAIVSVIALISVPLTTEAGEWLEHRLPSSALLRTHTELGDSMLPWAIGLTVVALLVLGRDLLTRRRARTSVDAGGPGAATATHRTPAPAIGGAAATAVLAVLAVVVSVGAVYTVYEIGDSGARAAWEGKFSPTPLPRAGGPVVPD